jgi:hypothetical protein
LTGVNIILVLILQIHLKLHQRSRCEAVPSSSDISWIYDEMFFSAYLDLRNQPLETADESTSSACDFVNAVFTSETSARALVDPTELTG